MTIRSVVLKPSNSIRMMVKGLENLGILKFETFTAGENIDGECCGCVSTAAIQQLMSRNFVLDDMPPRLGLIGETQKEYRSRKWAELCKFEPSDIRLFEDAIDHASYGMYERLFVFFGIEPEKADKFFVHGEIKQGYTDKILATFMKSADKLEKAGY